jgi:two-component system catabolic regulation response regulator CreB
MRGVRILVVEDEPVLAEAAAFALRREGLEVTVAPTLAAARQALVEAPPALVVLDVGLPDGNGFDFCRALRRTSTVPVLFLTARSDEVDRIVGLELGADDYLGKPFSPRELAARVKAVLRRCAPAPAAPAAALVIDADRHRATWHGVVLDLPPLTFRVLALLASRPGRVWTRSEILDRCCTDPADRFDRAVDSQVRHLRAALRAVTPDHDPVRTVRGEGYALDDGV